MTNLLHFNGIIPQTINFNGAPVSSVYFNNNWVWGISDPWEELAAKHSALVLVSPEYFYFDLDNHMTWDGDLEYSLDMGETWKTFNFLGGGPNIVTQKVKAILIDGNYTILLRGIGNTHLANSNLSTVNNFGFRCVAYGYIRCFGNVETLLDYETVRAGKHPPMGDYCYSDLFYGWRLIQAPRLPATTLTPFCYYRMFGDCPLTKAPELSATTLAERCYEEMFYGCDFLIEAPKLPATEVAEYCYRRMFNGCTSLAKAPELPATTLAEGCYHSMFWYCASLTEAPELPATELAERCYLEMFRGCPLTEAPELPAIILAEYCYQGMFFNCNSLTKAPELPATTLAEYCYFEMFNGCDSLTEAPELPATTLAEGCYRGMFNGCDNLVKAPSELPATILVEECYRSMFASCMSLENVPKISATSMEKTAGMACWFMFDNCSNLISLPALYATEIAVVKYGNDIEYVEYHAYDYMFYDCPKIKISETRTDECPNEYRVPITGVGTTTKGLKYLGIFHPLGIYINQTYYTNATVIY